MKNKRFPSIKTVALATLSSKRAQESVDFLRRNKRLLAKYDSFENFILDEDETISRSSTDEKIWNGCAHHLTFLSNILAVEMWKRDALVGKSIIDSVLFSSFIFRPSEEPIRASLDVIRDSGVMQPGIFLYPLHGLGVIGGGPLLSYLHKNVWFSIPTLPMVLTPQTLSIKKTISFIKSSAETLGVKKKSLMI